MGLDQTPTASSTDHTGPADGNTGSEGDASDRKISIQIRRMGAGTELVKIAPDASVHELKELIRTATGVATADQRLLYSGRLLRDDVTLCESGLSNDGDAVQLVEKPQPSPNSTSTSASSGAGGGGDTATPSTTNSSGGGNGSGIRWQTASAEGGPGQPRVMLQMGMAPMMMGIPGGPGVTPPAGMMQQIGQQIAAQLQSAFNGPATSSPTPAAAASTAARPTTRTSDTGTRGAGGAGRQNGNASRARGAGSPAPSPGSRPVMMGTPPVMSATTRHYIPDSVLNQIASQSSSATTVHLHVHCGLDDLDDPDRIADKIARLRARLGPSVTVSPVPGDGTQVPANSASAAAAAAAASAATEAKESEAKRQRCESPLPRVTAQELRSLTIGELKKVAANRGVNSQGCCEKDDLVARILAKQGE